MEESVAGPIPQPFIGQLLHNAWMGDRESLARLLALELPKLRESAADYLRHCNRTGWLDDVCQETVVKLMKLINHANSQRLDRLSNKLSDYLFKIAKNITIDRFRNERRKSTLEKIKLDQAASQSKSERDYPLNREVAETLIAHLPIASRPYFTLRFVEGREPEDAALALGITKCAAYKREQRGMQFLEQLVGADPQLAERINGPI